MAVRQGNSLSQAELQRLWQERCATGQFSKGIKGTGTIRVFGPAGDAPLTYPVIESLAALDSLDLAPDELYALEVGRRAVEQAVDDQHRSVVAAEPGQQQATSLKTFDPSQQNILILSMTTGG